MYKAAVLTVSDRCARGERRDEGGPLTAELLRQAGYQVLETAVVPDEQPEIEAALRHWCDERPVEVCDRLTPGIPEAMRYASMQITPRGMLSRAQAGIRKGTLIVNLPGSPKAVRENLEAVLPTLSHGLEMLSGGPADCSKLAD